MLTSVLVRVTEFIIDTGRGRPAIFGSPGSLWAVRSDCQVHDDRGHDEADDRFRDLEREATRNALASAAQKPGPAPAEAKWWVRSWY